MPLTYTRHFHTALSFPAADTGMYYELFSIEDVLNSVAEDRQLARMSQLQLEATCYSQNASYWSKSWTLVIVACTEQPTSGSTIASNPARHYLVLDAACGDEYAFDILDMTASPVQDTYDVANSRHDKLWKLSATYTPPKGIDNLFASDEHLDEVEMRSYVGVVAMRRASDSADTTFVDGIARLRYNLVEKSIRLSEL